MNPEYEQKQFIGVSSGIESNSTQYATTPQVENPVTELVIPEGGKFDYAKREPKKRIAILGSLVTTDVKGEEIKIIEVETPGTGAKVKGEIS